MADANWTAPKTEDELKQLARDWMAGKLFFSTMVRNVNDLPAVFMILALMTPEQRQECAEARYEVVYEYLDKCGPMTVNGYPTFFSAGFLTAPEYEKVRLYKQAADQAVEKALG